MKPALSNGVRGSVLFAEMARVLDPFAAEHDGQLYEAIKPVLARLWSGTFDVELPEPTLTRCAQSIENRKHWSEVLWPHGWDRPVLPRVPAQHR